MSKSKNRNKNDWSIFQVVSIVVLIIIFILNLIGTLATMFVVEQMSSKSVLSEEDITAKNMPYTEDTPYEIYRKPVNPDDSLIIK